MLLRLTTPETFDALVEYLEKERDLQWPDVNFSDGSNFRDYYINKIKEEMKTDVVLVDIDWRFDPERRCIVADLRRTLYSEIDTDQQYLKDDPHRNEVLD